MAMHTVYCVWWVEDFMFLRTHSLILKSACSSWPQYNTVLKTKEMHNLVLTCISLWILICVLLYNLELFENILKIKIKNKFKALSSSVDREYPLEPLC